MTTIQPTGNVDKLQKYLLLPRRRVGFKKVAVADSGTKIAPVVITQKDPDFVGLRSGPRSGLVVIDGKPFKIEGCNIENAIGKKIYRAHDNGTPAKGFLLGAAEERLEAVRKNNERLTSGGFPVAYTPEEVMHYRVEFRYSPLGILAPVIELFGANPYTVSDELAAPAFAIQGDTRTSELYRLKPKDDKTAREVAHRLGLMAGAQSKVRGVKKRYTITDPKIFSRWARGYVVFLEGEQVYLAFVGDEDDFLRRNVKPLGDVKTGYEGVEDAAAELLTRALMGEVEDLEDLEYLEEVEGAVEGEIVEKLVGYAAKELSGNRTPRQPYHHKAFRERFEDGFGAGYKNPDKREPIARADLRVAYGLAI